MTVSIDLVEKIKAEIGDKGPMTVADFMNFVLNNNENSYYISKLPIGKEGDFVTAPEISQIFGEVVGAWCANLWQRSGSPKKVNLIELGPGNGTLMKDLLRATKSVAGFHESININLVEINPHLQSVQKEAVVHPSLQHHKSFDDVEEGFSIIIANEFFDVLPINQYIKKKGRWHINMVDLNSDRSHLFINFYDPPSENMLEFLNKQYTHVPDEGIIEISDESNVLMKKITQKIKQHGGGALVIDYGYSEARERSFISTLQSVKSHKFHPLFQNIGSADITAHVSFSNLSDTAKFYHGFVHGPITQREFLQNMYAEVRKNTLLKSAQSKAEQAAIVSGYNRLIDPKGMGSLFKAIAITGKQIYDIGF